VTHVGRSAALVGVLACSVALLLGSATVASATGPGGWDHLGTGVTPTSGSLDGRVDALISVRQFAQIPDSIYAGGVFTSAGGNAATAMIARWDGSAWHSIGAPVISTVTGATVHTIAYDGVTGKLYVGGNFSNAGGNANADFVAVWDGASWQPFCAPISANVSALQIVGRKLYIGGDFADGAGLPAADKLVACDLDTGAPSATVDVVHQINGSVEALTADAAGNLYAGGSFINLDAIPAADHVAKYNGATWSAMDSGVDDHVRSLASDGTNVFIGTDALDIGGLARADHVARWDGSAWHALGTNSADNNGWFSSGTAFINAMAVNSAGTLFVTGSFQNADGHATADQVAGFNGFSWAPLGSDGAGNGPLPGPGNALTLFGGQVVVGGNFVTAGGDERASYIARYPGAARPLTAVIRLGNGGFSPFVGSTATFDASASDGDEPIVAYRWHFNDGSPDTAGATVAHVLTKQGTTTVTLTVTDSAGHTAQATEDFFIAGMYPQARFTWSPSTVFAGDAVAFDGSASNDADGTIAAYDWQWGDASPDASTAKPTHTFAAPGTYQVALFVRDDNTQSGAAIHNVTVVALVLPSVSHASLTNKSFRVGSEATAVAAKAKTGTSFGFTLTAPGNVTIAIARSARGVKRGKRCVAAPAKLKPHAKRCTRAVKAGTLTRSHLRDGPNAIAFSGRIGTRALTPGKYTATLTASNAKGKAKPITLKFTIVK
jgi:PKD repeat protein